MAVIVPPWRGAQSATEDRTNGEAADKCANIAMMMPVMITTIPIVVVVVFVVVAIATVVSPSIIIIVIVVPLAMTMGDLLDIR